MERFFKTMAFTLLGLVLSMNLWSAEETIGTYEFTNGTTMPSGVVNNGGIAFSTSRFCFDTKNDNIVITPSIPVNAATLHVTVTGIMNSTTATAGEITISGLDSNGSEIDGTAGKYTQTTGDASTVKKIDEGAKEETTIDFSATNVVSIKINCSTYSKKYIVRKVVITCTLGDDPDPTEPSLSVSPATIDFGTVEKNATIPAGQEVEVTFANLTTNDVTASITGDFNISKSGSFTSGDKITVTPKSTATIGTIEGTLTVKATTDDITKTVSVTMTVAAPEVGVSFEKATSAYTDWTFTNFASQQTHSAVTAHTGAYFGTTNSKESGSMVTKTAIAKPGTLQFFISKTTDNTTASNWKVSVSNDNSNWTQVGENISATGMTKGNWQEVSVALTEYSNVYVKIEYAGSTAVRCIDDVVFIAPQSYNVTLATSPTSVGTVTAKVNNVVIGEQVEEGQTVTLSAAPNDAHAYRFKEWQSDDVTIENNAFEMPNKAVSITAVFEPLYAVSLTTAGEGSGTATINGGTSTIYVSEDDEITLVAEPAAGSEFGGWTASNENIIFDNASSASTTALAGAAGTITATFGVSALLPLDAPTLSDPTNVTYNSVTLNWQELANAEGGYHVEILLNDEPVVYESGIGETSWTPDFTFQANTTYTYTVQGIGDGSTYAEENNPKAKSTFTTADYPAATLTLSENGVETPVNGKLNTPITLPTTSTQACDGKVFMGWSENPIEGEVGKDQVSLLDATYTFTDPEQLTKTIYAVYAKEVEGDKYFEKVSSAPADWCGKYLIVYETGNLAMDGSLATLDAPSNTKAVTISNNKIAWSQEMENSSFTVAYKTGSSTVYSLKSASGKYISGTTTSAKASNGLSSADTDANYEISFDGLTLQSKSSDQQMVLKYNKANDQTRFRFYKSGQEAIAMYKYSATIDYSNYCTTCEAAIAVPTFSLAEGEYDEAKTLTLSAAEGDIYYTINDGEETKYTAAIALNNRGTYKISAYAKVEDRESETVTKTYTLNWPYTLDELAASDVADGTSVQVTFENKEITNFYTNSQGKRYGIYVNVQKGGKDVEIYCNKAEHSNTWEVGGKVSSAQAISGTWTYYSGGSQWEFCPSNWDNISYTAPAKITSLVIDGDVTNKNYTAGQKLDFTGLTVTGVYSDNTDQNAHTEDVTDEISWTEVTLTQGQESATATATLNSVKTGSQDVKATKSITGLTVGAAKTLESIYVADDSEHKTAFFVGRPFSAEGLKVMARYNIGEDQPIALANLTIDNPTFSAAEAEHTINISYTENEVEKSTSYKVSVGYMNLSDLVAEDIPTNTSVKVSFSDVEITGFYKNKSEQRTGVYVNVKGKNNEYIELYSSGTPSETLNGWQEGGKLASKGNYITGTWKYYETNDVWEIDFGSSYAWATNIEYTAPSIYPTGIAMSIPSATVKQSKSLDLDAIFTPANATVLNNLAWESDNAKVTVVPSQDKKSAKVTVASDATVGTATITVKVDDKDGNELSATCVITIQEYSAPHYGLYTGDITEGDYIFKADDATYFMNNTINSSRLTNVASEDNPDIINNVITTEAEAYVWHIAKSGDYWIIQNLANSKYAAGTGTKNQAQLLDACTDNMAKWTITYDETNEVYTFENLGRSQASSYSDNKYLRNNDNSGWACYQSGTGNAITLYKAGFTPAAALQSIEIQGTLSITEYFQGKSVKYDGLSVLGHYSDETSATITDGIEWSASPASFSDLGPQTVTITATVTTKSGDVTDDAVFDVSVVESQQVNYGLVTNVATLYDGATIILGAVFGTAAAPIYAVNQGFESKYLNAYRSNTEGSDLEYENEVMKTAYASEITLKKVEGGWKLLGEDGKYINGAGDLSQTTDVAEATVWTISIEDGVAKIASGSNIIYYNTSSPRFKTYTSAQQEIGIYMKEVERETLRENLENGKMYSYCPAYDLALVEGAIFYQPDYMDAAYVHFVEVTEIKAGYGYILEGKGEALKAVQVGEEVTTAVAADADNTRGMQGVLKGNANYDINGENEGYQFPATSYSQALVSNNHLQYVGKDNVIIVGRAYLDLDIIATLDETTDQERPGARRVAINFGGQAPTNLDGINGNMKAAKVLRDGQLYIIREAKTYNAQGIEVQ